MKTIILISIILSLLSASSCGYSSIPMDLVGSWIDEYSATYTNNDTAISASALIYFQMTNGSSSPSVFWKINGKCYDINGNEWSQQPTASAVFRLADVSKLLTATATMQLYEKGLITLDDEIVQHIPWLTEVAKDDRIRRVTVMHLLTNTLGVDNRIINSYSEVCTYFE